MKLYIKKKNIITSYYILYLFNNLYTIYIYIYNINFLRYNYEIN